MKKLIFSCLCAVSPFAVSAQDIVEATDITLETPKAKSGWEISAGGISHIPSNRMGVSGQLRYFLKTNDADGNGFMITLKGFHVPPDNGGSFFSLLDGGKYNNMTAINLTGGYRLHLSQSQRQSNVFYVDFNLGLALTSPEHVGVAFNNHIGYKITKRLSIFAGHNANFTGTTDPDSFELGFQFRLK